MAHPFHRGSQFTNEESTQKISHSVYVTNFPDSVTSRDLWNTCSVYGSVDDVFIPLKKSKAGKRFSFVRFIKVNNLVRLVENLCTIWIGRCHLSANPVRFERPHKSCTTPYAKPGVHSRPSNPCAFQHSNGRVGSYVNAVNGKFLGVHGSLISSSPALVLDDTCLADRNLTKHAMGKVNDITSISNLYTILNDEGFSDVKLTYLEGTWVLFEFDKMDTKEALKNHTGVNSWFHVIQDVCNDFVSEERIIWVDIKGVPLNAWSRKTFVRIGKIWGETLDLEDNADVSFGPHKEREYLSEDESVQAPNNNDCIPHSKVVASRDDYASDDDGVPETVFGSNSSLYKHDNGDKEGPRSEDPFELYDLLNNKKGGDNYVSSPSLSHPPRFTLEVSKKHDNNATDIGDTDCKKVVNNGGSVLGVMEDIIRVGQAMGYTMEGCVKDLEDIIGQILWDYISTILGRWNGEAIIMGDFNEVRSSDERRRSCFNPYSARLFDRFISNSGLVDVTLEGYAFTWSHPSASKMSKLDRFLVSDGIFSIFPSLTALCLDRHLSDHRPVLFWEVHLDFGPTPFRFYHSWFDFVGFDELIKTSWQSFSHSDDNGMTRFKKKLQDLKVIIRRWIKVKRLERSGSKNDIVTELGAIDKDMDRGVVNDDNVLRRLEPKRNLLNVTEMEAKDRYQKSKVKWAIKGDENSKFFHGIINKRRSQLAIRARFQEPPIHRFKLNFQFHKKLLQSQADDLERCVSRDEIRRAVWDCGDNKFPGSDGYTFEFFKKQILDGPFILDEILHWCKRKKKQAMFFKVDFAKAYDSVRWDYLLDVLEAFGFGHTWCKWIQGTLSSAKASILVNESPSKEFSCHRGLKQGDPLAPYLFILVMESLHISFSREIDEGLSKGIFLPNSISISHLFYADDAMFLGEWSDEKGFDFWSHCKKRIGNGINTHFWSDCWIGDLPLDAKFPHLYALELDKDASVAVKLSAPVDISFRRRARGGLEQHLMAEMQSMLDLISLSNSSDIWFCDLASDGIFRVKGVRNFIDDLFLPSHLDSTRWVKSIPIKINIFTWRARRDCLPTRANLVHRGVRLESPLCLICLSCEEDVHHILFRCDLALIILRRICRWWDLDSQGWSSFKEWQTWFFSICLSSKVKSLLDGVFSVAWWSIWRFRNRSIFEKNPPRHSSKESVGTSTARVILFGIIPTAILATVPMVDPPVVHDDTPLIPTETPTISPFVSTLPHTSLFLYSNSSNSDTSERPPLYDPYEVTVARWRGRVAARSSPPSSPTHDSPPNLRQILPAPPGLPRRPVILVLSGQSIPVGRPYHTQPNGSHSSSDNFLPDDFSSDTSSDSSLGYSAYTSSVTLATPVPGALSPVRADLLPPYKRIRGSVSATDYKVSSEESYEPYTEPDIDFDVQADIDACITADDATAARETDVRVEVGIETDDEVKEEAVSSARGTIEIGMDRVIDPVVADDAAETMPTATRTGITPVVIEEMIERRVEEALEAYRNREPTRENEDRHGDDNGNKNENGNGDGGENGYENGLGGGNGNGNPNVNVGGVVPAIRECTYQDFLKCQPLTFKGNEVVVGLTRWLEKMKTVFHISNCPLKYQVKYASCTLQNGALTWWNSHKRTVETDAAYAMTWRAMMKLMTKEEDQVKKFIRGLPDNIQGNVIATEPTRLRDAVDLLVCEVRLKFWGVTVVCHAGSESRPPMLNKENYVPWSSRLLRYAKSRPNRKLIHNFILNGPYVRRMIPEPCDANRDVNVTETFHEQTDDELFEKELKQIEADDQAIQTILLGLPEDIYAAVDSCETAQEIWLRVQ
nr:RNA-directed DNA polymerase, eukaryota [Tanacetum cinerariifolium]